MKISFLIVDFLKAEKVLVNINGILNQNFESEISGERVLEISVVDNSCCPENKRILETGIAQIQKKYAEEFAKKERVIFCSFPEKNLGYTKGNNLAAKQLQQADSLGEYIFVINPDIIWTEKDTVQKILDHMQKNPEVGVCAPRQKNILTGQREISVREFPHLWLQIVRRTALKNFWVFKHLVEKDEMQGLDSEKTQEVDWIQSSFFVVEKSLWEKISGFNEKYFLFMADTEMCFDAWKYGKKVQFFSETEVGSDGLRCSDGGVQKFFTSWTLRQHFLDALQYSFSHVFEQNPRDLFLNFLKKGDENSKIETNKMVK